MAASDVIESFTALPEEEKVKAAAAIQASRPLPPAPAGYVGTLWVMVVGAFIALLLGGTLILYLLVHDSKSTEVIGPLVTGALGVLAGLLAPSPVQANKGGGNG